MASNNTHGYRPVDPIDWKELLQSLVACIETMQADNPQSPVIDAKGRAGFIGNYITELESCLDKANRTTRYYESLVKNFDRLVSVIEESRNQAYDIISRLKQEVSDV